MLVLAGLPVLKLGILICSEAQTEKCPEGAGCGEMGLLSKKWGNGFGEETKIATQGRAPNHKDNAII